jgi:pimeloyl-ACP methyl ester carboxylesterase
MKTLLPLTLALLGAFASPCALARVPFITWASCPAELTGDTWPELGERLHCGKARMPFDHLKPDGRTIEVGIVRIAAEDSSQREGAIFVNVGGPGGQPATFVASMAAAFGAVDAADPVHGDMRRLAQRFDLIAVIPRGLKGGWTYECEAVTPTRDFLPAHRDDDNWSRAIADARAQARACSVHAEAAYLSTEQHARDMDAVRASLGDDTLNFYGISYGGRVGATYAALYPERMGRMLLDSSIMFHGSYRSAMYLTDDAQQQAFEARVLAPVRHEPWRYGQVSDEAMLRGAVRSFSDVLRPAWHDALVSPSHLAAALTMDRWVKATGWRDWRTLNGLAASGRFSSDAPTDKAIRHAAVELVDRGAGLSARQVQGRHGSAHRHDALVDKHGEWLNLAVMCNDEAWEPMEQKIRARADRDAFTYTESDGSQIFDQLTCSFWPSRVARSPDFSALEGRAPFLLIQSEHDASTPLAGARAMLARFPASRLVVARGSAQHGLLGQSATPCVESAALGYLLEGRLPAGEDRESSCAFVPVDPESADEGSASYEWEDVRT